jgi:hypothetical protein
MTDVGTVLRKTENRIKSSITPSRPKTKKSVCPTGCRVQDQQRLVGGALRKPIFKTLGDLIDVVEKCKPSGGPGK